jgi:hypothetical protein
MGPGSAGIKGFAGQLESAPNLRPEVDLVAERLESALLSAARCGASRLALASRLRVGVGNAAAYNAVVGAEEVVADRGERGGRGAASA